MTSAIVHGSDDGYLMFYDLARYAGHPGRNSHSVLPPVPRCQRDSDTLAAHILNWRHYFEHLALDGYYYSDRYFVLELVHSSHESIRFFLEHYLTDECSDRMIINCPLAASMLQISWPHFSC